MKLVSELGRSFDGSQGGRARNQLAELKPRTIPFVCLKAGECMLLDRVAWSCNMSTCLSTVGSDKL